MIGQDIHFSQFYFSPQTLNPAYAGNFNGAYRINNNMRRQWGSITPYSTFALSGEKQIYLKQHHLTGGLIILNDRSNNASLKINKIYLTGAYHKDFEKHALHFGLQAGFVNKSLNQGDLLFDNQYSTDLGDFSSSENSFETGFLENASYLDINLGAGWSGDFGKIAPFIGFSAFHVNMPNESFFNNNSKLPIRAVVNIGTNLIASEKVYLTPNFLYMNYNQVNQMVFGSSFTYVLSNNYLENSVFAGVYARNTRENFDAMIILVGGNYQHWTFGLSYDINMSDLQSSNANPGGIELAIIYRDISTQIKKFFIPCERF